MVSGVEDGELLSVKLGYLILGVFENTNVGNTHSPPINAISLEFGLVGEKSLSLFGIFKTLP